MSLLGAALPRDLMQGRPDNPLGFFEPVKIVEVHDELLAAAGSSWHDPSPIPEAWFEGRTARSFVDRLAALAEAQYGAADLLVLKDPRISRMMPLWIEVLRRLGVAPLFVIPFRHPWEVAASLERRNGFPFAKSEVMWLQHILLAEYGSRGLRRSFLSYEELLTDPRTALARVGLELGVEWRESSGKGFAEVESFLSTEHRHNRAEAIRRPGGRMPGLLAEAWAVLQSHKGGLGSAGEAAFDRIRDAYRVADELEGPLVRHLSDDVTRLADRVAELSRALAAETSAKDEMGAPLEKGVAERDGVGARLEES